MNTIPVPLSGGMPTIPDNINWADISSEYEIEDDDEYSSEYSPEYSPEYSSDVSFDDEENKVPPPPPSGGMPTIPDNINWADISSEYEIEDDSKEYSPDISFEEVSFDDDSFEEKENDVPPPPPSGGMPTIPADRKSVV